MSDRYTVAHWKRVLSLETYRNRSSAPGPLIRSKADPRFETSIANQSLSNSLCEELGFAKPFYELGQASRPESRKHFQFLLSASRLIHSLYSAKPMGSSARQILFGGGSRFVLNHWMCDRLLLTYCSRGCENSCLTLSKLFTCNLGTNSHTPRGWLCDPLLIHSWCFGRLLGSCWVVVCS